MRRFIMRRFITAVAVAATACLLFVMLPVATSAAQAPQPPLTAEGPPAAPTGPQAADLPEPIRVDAGLESDDDSPDRFEIDLFNNQAVIRVNSLTQYVGPAPHIDVRGSSDDVKVIVTVTSDAPSTLISLTYGIDSLELSGDTGDVMFTAERTWGDLVARDGTLRISETPRDTRISTTTPLARLTIDSSSYESTDRITISDDATAADGFSRVSASSLETYYCPERYEQAGTGALTTCSTPPLVETAPLIDNSGSIDGGGTYYGTCPAGYSSTGTGPDKTCTRRISGSIAGPIAVPDSFDWLSFAGFRTAWVWGGVGNETLTYESLDAKSSLRELHLMGSDATWDATTGAWAPGADPSNDTVTVLAAAPALELVTGGGWFGSDALQVDATYAGPVWLFGGSAEFWADDPFSTYLAFTGDQVNWLAGGAGNDLLVGGDERDRMRGEGGNDILEGLLAIDRLWGGEGNDTIYGGGGSDRIYGEDGDDRIWAGSGADRVFGGNGADIINGQGGQDFLWGDAGNDTIQGNHQSDEIFGGDGDDILGGAGGKDVLWGEAGDDILIGGDNSDQLGGGPGADDMRGGRGSDTCADDATDTTSSCRLISVFDL